jgi:hypothetical protein
VDRQQAAANIELFTTSRVQPTQALAVAAAAIESPVPVGAGESPGDLRRRRGQAPDRWVDASLRWAGCPLPFGLLFSTRKENRAQGVKNLLMRGNVVDLPVPVVISMQFHSRAQ